MSVEQVRNVFDRWYAAATAGDAMAALESVLSADCVVHAQDGEIGDRSIAQPQGALARTMFPDLEMDLDHLITTEDRLVAQVTLTAMPAPAALPPGLPHPLRALGAMIARVNERAEIAEVWPYLNPGAMLTFPPRANLTSPAAPSGEPGSEEQARGLAGAWTRAMTGPELVDRIAAAVARDCVVHATNADHGPFDLLPEQFAVMTRAFPDLTIAFEDALFDGDRFVLQFRLAGTQRGALGISPATGRRLESTGALVARVNAQGRAAEIWLYLAPGMGLFFQSRRR